MLAREGREHLAKAVFDFLPARAELDLAGWDDVDIFAHTPVKRRDNRFRGSGLMPPLVNSSVAASRARPAPRPSDPLAAKP